ncbi:MAG: hypothetical protein J5764_03520, partial [Bacteroidales bacterium]|nr:hypothetical protein [Bacteroidales bacterium]
VNFVLFHTYKNTDYSLHLQIVAEERKKGFAGLLEQEESRLRSKAEKKLPTLGGILELPGSLPLEQCSSEAAAEYKCQVAGNLLGEGLGKAAVADLTGGLGIDCIAFSKIFGRILYNEKNPVLFDAAKRNFAAAGAANTVFCNFEAGKDGNSSEDTQLGKALEGFRPDLIYFDPSRRSEGGSRVFLPEDCSPNPVTLVPQLRSICPRILVKLSPMADITMLSRLFGPVLTGIHIFEKDGECKELLLVFSGEEKDEPLITVATAGKGAILSFYPSREKSSEAEFAGCISVDDHIFEPGAALMKSGAFKLPCSLYSMQQLSASTHLYKCMAPEIASGAPGKLFRVIDLLPFSRAGFREAGKRYPRAEISARGVPVSSEELRGRSGCNGGGSERIFAVTLSDSTRKLLVCVSWPDNK